MSVAPSRQRRRAIAFIACATLMPVLAACANTPGPRYSDSAIDRALATAGGAAQPGKIVAAESAFARAAREDGQWTAFRAFAAPGAIIHGSDGGVSAADWLAGRADPDEAVRWAPRAVMMSCDGVLAVSRGRFLTPESAVGTFVTVWQQRRDGEYRWVYDAATLDDPQPVREDDAPPGDDEIVVTALDMVQGRVADCDRGADTPALPAHFAERRAQDGTWIAPDGTLSFHWRHVDTGRREMSVLWLKDGAWGEALTLSWSSAGAD